MVATGLCLQPYPKFSTAHLPLTNSVCGNCNHVLNTCVPSTSTRLEWELSHLFHQLLLLGLQIKTSHNNALKYNIMSFSFIFNEFLINEKKNHWQLGFILLILNRATIANFPVETYPKSETTWWDGEVCCPTK